MQKTIGTRLLPFGTSIFATISGRAFRRGAINLGQGFPDDGPPEALIDEAIEGLRSGRNQYAPMPGTSTLRLAIASDCKRRLGLDWAADSEITVTGGATGGLAATILGIVEPGDEVLLFDPAYDAYPPLVALAGGVGVHVAPAAPDFRITRELLEDAITPRTRMLLINTPWNPTGRVFDDEELAAIADVCQIHDLICVSDEVYERLIFDAPHKSIASAPGMRDRSVVISSLGKTYSCTGWKVGWACASGPLTDAIRRAHQILIFSIPEPLQMAAAKALNQMTDDWDAKLVSDYRARRDLLTDGLQAAGFKVILPEGTYFLLADSSAVDPAEGLDFCIKMINEARVAGIPASAFTKDKKGCRSFVRFAFCKSEATMRESIERLQAFARKQGDHS